jgi:curli production assembly/transport component CsgG
MKKALLALAIISALSGCAVTQKMGVEYKPEVAEKKLQKEFDTMPSPNGPRITVAVYSFKDQTGQRKADAKYASFSTAVTQGAEPFLISALQDVGRSQWFDVVERVNVDNLIKERTIIKQMRDMYEGPSAKPLAPLQFAGIIMEGGIVGYDSSSESGGAAYRWLGIGPQTQYSKDIVTISLRAVSVNTGKVLATVTVTKTVYSTADSFAMLKFFNDGTQAFEAETGLTINEPGTLAVKATVEAAVVELIKEGQRKGVWDFRVAQETKALAPVATEVKVEEKKDVVVQSQTKPETKTEELPSTPSKEVKKNALASLPGEMILNETAFIYKEANEKSQKTWQFKKGTQVSIVGSEGDWILVRDAEKRRGFVKKNVLVNKQ